MRNVGVIVGSSLPWIGRLVVLTLLLALGEVVLRFFWLQISIGLGGAEFDVLSISVWPLLLAGLWGGVSLSSEEMDQAAFFLARPLGRVEWPFIRLIGVVLALSVLGLILLAPSRWTGDGLLQGGGELLLLLVYVALCGAFSGSLVQERSSALGLAFVVAFLLSPLTQRVLVSKLRGEWEETPLDRWHTLLMCILLGGMMVYSWRRDHPTRNAQTANRQALFLFAGGILSFALWWVAGGRLG